MLEANTGPVEGLSFLEVHGEGTVAWYCQACNNLVTLPSHETIRRQKFEHTFFNPAGLVYTIGCFSQCQGVMVSGEPTHEFSWFKKYAWQFCHCQQCQQHLGWYYSKNEDAFFGLILTNLIAPN